jgi:hypothetical protein
MVGVYILIPKQYLSLPPFLERTSFPPLATRRFLLLLCPVCLNSFLFCIYLTPVLLPISLFKPFPFLPFSFPFLPFSLTLSLFFISPFHIFCLQVTLAEDSPGGGGYFPIYRPLDSCHSDKCTDLLGRGKGGKVPRHYCSLLLWRVHEIKRMYLDSRTHCLFIT